MLLIIPDKPDGERDAVASAWGEEGGTVLRLARFWEPPPVEPLLVRVYGPDTFCLVVAQKLGLELVSPPDDLVLRVGEADLKRRIVRETLGGLQDFPAFVKPLVPKLFRAGVYASQEALLVECRGLEDSTELLVAEPVTILCEARAFVLRGQLQSCAVYEGEGSLAEARSFLSGLAERLVLPVTCVLDAALIEGRGWALLEANATWGAGLNGCDARSILPCLKAAVARDRER